jgi:hypothetical protein
MDGSPLGRAKVWVPEDASMVGSCRVVSICHTDHEWIRFVALELATEIRHPVFVIVFT